MFTGIVEETGRVRSFAPIASGWRLEVEAVAALVDASLGDSIAVNGCCLTIVAIAPDSLGFDVLEETRRVTNLRNVFAGARVNLERSLRFGGKMGGHFVTGHIDGVGEIEIIEARGNDTYLRVKAPPACGRYLIHKGSIAIDGISLTVAEVAGDTVAVWLIPHTLDATNLHTRTAGDAVNLEFDLLGKYVEKLLPTATPA